MSYYLNWLFFLCGRNHISNNLLKLAEWLFLSNKTIFLKHSWWNYNFRWTQQWTNQRTVYRSHRIVSSNQQRGFQFKQPQRRNIFKSGKTIPISSKQTKGTSSKTNQTTLWLSLSTLPSLTVNSVYAQIFVMPIMVKMTYVRIDSLLF